MLRPGKSEASRSPPARPFVPGTCVCTCRLHGFRALLVQPQPLHQTDIKLFWHVFYRVTHQVDIEICVSLSCNHCGGIH